MEKILKNMMDPYKNNLLKTPNLQIIKENCSDETLCDEEITGSTSSFFGGCRLESLSFKQYKLSGG